jgi:hypothetical protein
MGVGHCRACLVLRRNEFGSWSAFSQLRVAGRQRGARCPEIHAWREQRDTAFRWLERAYSQRDPGMTIIKVDPLLKSIRLDPRYAGLLNRLHLSD